MLCLGFAMGRHGSPCIYRLYQEARLSMGLFYDQTLI